MSARVSRQSTTPDLLWRPAHVYVPGRSPRHDENLFDLFKTIDGPLQGSTPWRMGLGLMADAYYWEAHEVWEAVWLAAPPNSRDKTLVQAVIQMANAALKAKMGRPSAVARLQTQVAALLDDAFCKQTEVMGLTRSDIAQMHRNAFGPPV